VFDNVPHVKGYWIMLGQATAAAALHFGASDLDGTIGQEKIAHAALAKSPVGMAESGMVQMIREAGKIPVQRDALYRVIREYPRREEPATTARPAAIPANPASTTPTAATA
jgi:aminodeoxyfutalosine synthase